MGSKVLVFGSYVQEFNSRQPGLPVPGQTIRGTGFQLGYGGKGFNQAMAAHMAGADITFVAKVGDDSFGHAAMDFFAKNGMASDRVIVDDNVGTGVALVMVDEKTCQNQIVVVPGAAEHITDQDVENCRDLLEGCSIMLLQHEINMDAQAKAIDIAHKAGARIVLNPAPALPLSDDMLAKIDTVTPNESEALVLTGVEVHDMESARKAAKVFLDKGVKNAVITMGSMGAYATDGVREEMVNRLPVQPVDTTGAGDAFNGAFVTALSEGCDLFEALKFANVGGALSVTKEGSSCAMPSRAEIDRFYQECYGK